MVDITQSVCINHPGKEALNRCKQCGAPTCHKCTVPGPTGKFCSENCRSIHEAFIQRAQALQSKAPGTGFLKIRKTLGSLLFVAAVLLAAGVVGTVFYIPVLSELVQLLRRITGV